MPPNTADNSSTPMAITTPRRSDFILTSRQDSLKLYHTANSGLTAAEYPFYDANGVSDGYRFEMLSVPHMIVVFVVVLVVFGPKKLPELARGLGKLMAEFRKASTDFKSAFEEEMREMERQALQAERKKAAEAVGASAVAAETSLPSPTSDSTDSDAPPREPPVECHDA